REILEFETYSPKAFASIKEVPEDLRDRCLVIPLIRSQKNFPDPDDSGVDWSEIRGKLYKFLMTDFDLVSTGFSVAKINYREKQEKLGRSLELWLPIEIILDCCMMQDKIDDCWRRFSSQYGFAEYEPSELEEEVIKTLLAQLESQSEAVLTPKEISELIE